MPRLDGPATQTTLAVDTITVLEARVGGSAYPERAAVTLQPVDGKIFVYFGDADVAAPSAVTVAADGLQVFKNAKETYEAGPLQPIYLLAQSGTVSVKVIERS